MAFNPQQIFPLDLNPNKAIGVNIPFNGPVAFTSNYLTKDSIKNNLINFFLTNPGERYLNPNFGGGLKNFIFENILNDSTDFLIEDITNKISTFFPNVNINSLNISKVDDQNNIKIDLSYNIINTNITDNLEIEFE
jgi:phage baseplate assembly protein W